MKTLLYNFQPVLMCTTQYELLLMKMFHVLTCAQALILDGFYTKGNRILGPKNYN